MVKVYKYLLSLLVFSASVLAVNADSRIDSLEQELLTRQEANLRDEATIDILKNLSHHYFSTAPLKGIEYAEEAMAIAKEIKSKDSQGDIFNYFGNFYRAQGLLDMALEAHLNSVEISEAIGDTNRIVYALNDLGNIYYDQKDFTKALDIYSRAAELALNAQSHEALPVSYNNIGLVFYKKEDYDMAFSYFAKALKYRELQDEPELVGHSFNYLGMVYRAQENFRLATEYFGKALNKFKAVDNKLRIGDTYLNIGVNYAMQHDYETAFKCFERAEQYYDELDNKIELAHCLQMHGKYLMEANKLNEARNNLQKGLNLMVNNGFRGLRKQSLLLLSQVDDKLGDHKSAFTNYKAYSELKDSLSNVEISNKIARLEAAYLYRQKAKELALVQKENEVQQQKIMAQHLRIRYLMIMIIGLVVSAIIIAVLSLSRKKRKKLAGELKAKVAAFFY